MKQEIKTLDLALAIYLALEGCRITKLFQEEYKGKTCLEFKLINDNPNKDIDDLIQHYKKDLKPFVPRKGTKIVDVGQGETNFERMLMNAIFGSVD